MIEAQVESCIGLIMYSPTYMGLHGLILGVVRPDADGDLKDGAESAHKQTDTDKLGERGVIG